MYPKKKKPQVDYIKMLEDLLDKRGVVADYYHYFHNYSIYNQMMLLTQFNQRGIPPEPVATMKKWNGIGRKVKKGSKAFTMLMPIFNTYTRNTEDGEEEEVTYVFYTLKKHWFNVSSTEGARDFREYFETPKFSLSTILKNLKITKVPYTSINGNCQGYCERYTGDIAINPIATHPDKTAIHEIAHSLMHCGRGATIHDEEGNHEAEAESVALLVGTVLGIIDEKTQEESVGYIKRWMKHLSTEKDDFLKESAKKIIRTVDKILKANLKKEKEEI